MKQVNPGHPGMKRRDSLRRATASRALPLISGYGLNLFVTPILASSLGLAQFGLWALTGSVAQYGSLLDLGVSRSVTRFTALHVAENDHEAADRVVWTAAALVLIMATPLILLGLLVAEPLANVMNVGDVDIVRAVIVASLMILVTGQFVTILLGSAYGREIQTLPNTVITACGLTGAILSTLVAFWTVDLVMYAWSVAVWNAVTLCIIAVTVHSKIARLRPVTPQWATLKRLAAFGLQGQSLLLAELLVFQSSKLLLGAVSGTTATGAYELGSRLALGFRTLGGMFTSALTAPLTRAFSQSGALGVMQEANRLTTRIATLSVVPPLIGLALTPALLSLWLGDYAELTLVTMAALCGGFAANMITGVQGVVSEAIGRPVLNAKAAFATAVMSLTLGGALLPLMGSIGVPIGTGVATLVGSMYNVAVVQPAIGSTQRHYYGLVVGPLALGLGSSLLAYLSYSWINIETRAEATLATTFGVIAFLGVYVPASFLMRYLPRHYLKRPGR